MPATVVQATTVTDTVVDLTTVITVSATAPGSALFAFNACATKTRVVTGVADSAGNALWQLVSGNGASGAGHAYIWWCPYAPLSVTSVTATYDATTSARMSFIEVTGLSGKVGAGGAPSTNITVATTAPALAVTQSETDDFVVAMYGGGAAPSAIAAPFALVPGCAGTTAGVSLAIATATVAAIGTDTATWTTASAVTTLANATFPLARVPRTAPPVGQAVNRGARF